METALRTTSEPTRMRARARNHLAVLGVWTVLAIIGAPALAGPLSVRLGWRVLPALLLAAGIIVAAPSLSARLGWRRLLVVSFLATAAWAVALAFVDGAHALRAPLESQWDYLGALNRVPSPHAFLQTFVAHVPSFPTHVQSHPPGMMLILWALATLGLRGSGWEAALVILVGASAIPAIMMTVRAVTGEGPARAAAPFLVLAPAALWIATTADALFAGVTAWAITLVVLACARGRQGDAFKLRAIAGGLLFGTALMLSYGLLLAAIVPLAVGKRMRQHRPLIVAGITAVGVLLVAAAFGFSWPTGLLASRARYVIGYTGHLPYLPSFVRNVGVLALVCGPATAMGLFRKPPQSHGMWTILGASLLAIAIANFSGMAKAEVERIWLPFSLWIILAAGAVPARSTGRAPVSRPWLAANAATAIIMQTLVHTTW